MRPVGDPKQRYFILLRFPQLHPDTQAVYAIRTYPAHTRTYSAPSFATRWSWKGLEGGSWNVALAHTSRTYIGKKTLQIHPAHAQHIDTPHIHF